MNTTSDFKMATTGTSVGFYPPWVPIVAILKSPVVFIRPQYYYLPYKQTKIKQKSNKNQTKNQRNSNKTKQNSTARSEQSDRAQPLFESLFSSLLAEGKQRLYSVYVGGCKGETYVFHKVLKLNKSACL